LITKAAELSDNVDIGITTDKFIRKKTPTPPSLQNRIAALHEYLSTSFFGPNFKVSILDDKYGSAVKMRDLDAIVVSEETLPNAIELNKKRREKGLPALAIEVIPLVLAEDGKKLSSTRMRTGELDENGVLVNEIQV
jgi:pantetheine-phosphate adenylyltransferase